MAASASQARGSTTTSPIAAATQAIASPITANHENVSRNSAMPSTIHANMRRDASQGGTPSRMSLMASAAVSSQAASR